MRESANIQYFEGAVDANTEDIARAMALWTVVAPTQTSVCSAATSL